LINTENEETPSVSIKESRGQLLPGIVGDRSRGDDTSADTWGQSQVELHLGH